MQLLHPNDYNASYFDGKHQTLRHNAGYSEYNQGDSIKNIYTVFLNTLDFTNKKILDIGCAKGFLVELLRNDNIQAYGIDCSKYAIDNAPTSIKPYLNYGVLPTALDKYSNNEFDIVISSNFLCCLSDSDIIVLIKELNRIGKMQCHLTAPHAPKKFYNPKTIQEWIQFDWKHGTIITDFNSVNIIK